MIFLPSGLRSPEQEGEPGLALIFMAFVINGVVPTLVSRHGWLNTNLPGWQSTRHPSTSLVLCSDCWSSSWRCHRWHGYYCLSLFFSSWCCFLLSLEEDILLFCYVSHLLALKSNKSLLKSFTFSTLFENRNVCLSFFLLFQRHTTMKFYFTNVIILTNIHLNIYSMCKTASCDVLFFTGWEFHLKLFGRWFLTVVS